MSRDPIEERGGVSLTGFVQNTPGDTVDLLGLKFLVAPRVFPNFTPRVIPRPIPSIPFRNPSPLNPIPNSSPLTPYIPAPEIPSNVSPKPVPQKPSPNPDSEPSWDSLPRLNDIDKAPASCSNRCTPERLKELNQRVEEACGKKGGGTPSCVHPWGIGNFFGDSWQEIVDKKAKIDKCIKARERRERECWNGGDKGHIIHLNQLKQQSKDCDKADNWYRRQNINEDDLASLHYSKDIEFKLYYV